MYICICSIAWYMYIYPSLLNKYARLVAVTVVVVGAICLPGSIYTTRHAHIQ